VQSCVVYSSTIPEGERHAGKLQVATCDLGFKLFYGVVWCGIHTLPFLCGVYQIIREPEAIFEFNESALKSFNNCTNYHLRIRI
jgi:hypothetical protein